MSDWKSKVPRCFGNTDKLFAGHPTDEECAFELLRQLRAEGVGWAEFAEAVQEFLKDTSPQHQKAEMAKIDAAMKPWLLD